MVNSQNVAVLGVTYPAAIVDNASWTTVEIDTVQSGVKYNYADIYVMFGAMDIAVTAFKVQESDTSGSGFADVTNAVGGTDFTLPSATSDNTLWCIRLDLRKRKRYLDLVLTGGDGAAGTYAAAWVVLSRGNETPVNATAHGLATEIIV